MSLFERLKNVASGTMSNLVGDLERSNPEAVYEAALERGIARIAEHKDAAAGLAAQRNKIADKIEAAKREQKQVQLALSEALNEGDDEVAVVLLARKDEVEKQVADLEREHTQVDTAVEETKHALKQLKADIQALKREKDTAVAQLQSAQASIDIHEANSGLGTDATSKGLESIRSNIGVLDARANEGWQDEEGNSVRGRAEALGRKGAEAKARAELERLKRMARGDAEPKTAAPEDVGDGEDDGGEADGGEGPKSSLPKRTL